VSEAPWLAALDEATYPRSTVLRESWVAEAVGDMGVTHVRSGWGGDEFVSFNGRGTNRAIVRSLRWHALRSAYRDRRRRGRSAGRALVQTVGPGLPNWSSPQSGWSPGRIERHRARVAAVEVTFPDIHADYLQHERSLDRATGPQAYQLELISRGHIDGRIDSWHQMALRFGFEYGYPLLDRRLVEWSLGMPPEMFRDGEHSRRVFRMALAGSVSNEVRSTQKADPVLFDALAVECEECS
jgi:asparagine synthase (glutamine-hydrolysing)